MATIFDEHSEVIDIGCHNDQWGLTEHGYHVGSRADLVKEPSRLGQGVIDAPQLARCGQGSAGLF